MMNTNSYLKILPVFLLFVVIGCNNVSLDNQVDETDLFGEVECKYTYDSNGVKNGKYECFYPHGKIWMSGTIKNDSIKIYEDLLYSPTGQLKEYGFYNPIGERRYRRVYDKDGKLIKEVGDFLSHVEIDDTQIQIGDSTTLRIFVASPPGTMYKIYGVSSKGRYEMSFEKTNTPYFQKKFLYADKPGNYIFPYEVEFIDTITGVKEVRKDDVSFKVTE